MNDGDFLSPSKPNLFLMLTEAAARRLRLSTFSFFAAPFFFSVPAFYLTPKPVFAQSVSNVSEDENHIWGDWISALRLDEEDEKKPILCRLSGNYGKFGLWASKEGLEITSEDANWNLPEKSGGAVTLQIKNHLVTEHIDPNKDGGEPIKPMPFRGRLTADFQDTFFMLAQTPERMAASITIERLLPLLAALEQGESATLRFGTRSPEPLPLSGTQEAISDFRECAFKNHFADLRATAESDENILEGEDESEKRASNRAKQNQDPYKNPFTPKSSENPWPESKETPAPVIDEEDDPDAPETPNEFSEQPKSPGAPLPLTEEEQAEIDQKRAEAVQEKERLEEEVRQKQIEIAEEEEAKKRAAEREAKRLADIAAAQQARQARKERAAARAQARRESLKAANLRARKEREAARKKALIEPKAPPSQDTLKAHQIQAQSAVLSAEMQKAQAFMADVAKGTKNQHKKVSANLAAKQIASARHRIQTQAEREALEVAQGSKEVQNERAENANISLSQTQTYLETQAQKVKNKKARQTSKKLSSEMQAAQNFLQAQNALQDNASLTTAQKASAKNKLPFAHQPATFREKIAAKPLPNTKQPVPKSVPKQGAGTKKSILPFSDQNPTTLPKIKKET
ncbi:hypothetical protein FAI41_03520 [Acetobacteraceae bacterium]|nr:hypothetical protein FAI41_03520 [Acetobacteraceae bacterium]